jgi:hypothetical protein
MPNIGAKMARRASPLSGLIGGFHEHLSQQSNKKRKCSEKEEPRFVLSTGLYYPQPSARGMVSLSSTAFNTNYRFVWSLYFSWPLFAIAFARQSFFDPALFTGLQVVGVAFDLLNDIFLLHLPLKAPESGLKAFALLHVDFRQPFSPPSNSRENMDYGRQLPRPVGTAAANSHAQYLGNSARRRCWRASPSSYQPHR